MNINHNTPTQEAALCIVGAGLAGLNALFVAAQYLSKKDTVIIVDQKDNLGGMWQTCYNHVRLHQPYRLFTAGNMPWRLRKDMDYLADRQEILQHFQDCMQQLREQVNLVEYFSYKCTNHQELSDDGGAYAQVELQHVHGQQPDIIIKTKRFINAAGFNVQPKKPLAISSNKVHSITPESDAFLGKEMTADQKPVYVIGGGKTGTDAAYHLAKAYPNRPVHMIVGKGTAFIDRSKVFPKSFTQRYFGGKLFLAMLHEIVAKYDGSNSQEVFNYFIDRYGLVMNKGKTRYSMYGVLSPEEMVVLNEGVEGVVNDYMEDVMEENGQPVMVLRSGKKIPVEEGSWVVNCTGHLLRGDHTYKPFLSPKGTSISIQQTSAIFFVTSFGAYFLTHLLFLDKFKQVPLYELNHEQMMQKDKEAYFSVAAVQVMYNLMVLLDHLPYKVILNCGINFDNWYPLYRLLGFVAKLKLNKKAHLRRWREILDKVEVQYDVQCRLFDPTPR